MTDILNICPVPGCVPGTRESAVGEDQAQVGVPVTGWLGRWIGKQCSDRGKYRVLWGTEEGSEPGLGDSGKPPWRKHPSSWVIRDKEALAKVRDQESIPGTGTQCGQGQHRSAGRKEFRGL